MQLNIFRDRHERKASTGPKPSGCVLSGTDWPEAMDEQRIFLLQDDVRHGKPLDRTAMLDALEGLQRITPSSPLWEAYRGLQDAAIYERWRKNLLGDT